MISIAPGDRVRIAPWPPSVEQASVVGELTSALREGRRRMVLKGATGTGKTYAMSQLIANTGMPTLVLAPNKVLAAQLWAELKGFLPHNAVEYFVSYYGARVLCQICRFVLPPPHH